MMSVEFKGLVSMAHNLHGVPRFMSGAVSKLYTRPLMMFTWQRYVDNLHGPRRPVNYPGPVPATLPVGVRTGQLLAGANKRQINQWSFWVFNPVEHAAYIEFGTSRMAPRRPLGDAVEQAEAEVSNRMGEVANGLVDYCHN